MFSTKKTGVEVTTDPCIIKINKRNEVHFKLSTPKVVLTNSSVVLDNMITKTN